MEPKDSDQAASLRLRKIFCEAKLEPDTSLNERVLMAVVAHNKKLSRIKLWVFGIAGACSFVGLVPALKILSLDLGQSGFFEYFSLIFSDSGTVITYWKELSFSLAEALPAMSIILTLSLFFVCLFSIRHLIQNMGRNTYYEPRTIINIIKSMQEKIKNLKEEIKKVFESQTSFRVLLLVGCFIVAMVIFSAGVSVGFHKASFGKPGANTTIRTLVAE